MAGGWSCCLLLTVVCLLLAVCSSGDYVGHSSSRAPRGDVRISSEFRTVMFCSLTEIPACTSSVHLVLDGSVVENLIMGESSGFSSLECNIRTSFRQQRFYGIVLDFGNKHDGDLYLILSAVRSVHEVVGGTRLDNQRNMKLSVLFPALFLEKLGRECEREWLQSIFNSFEDVLSMVIVDAEEDVFRIALVKGAVVASSLAERAVSVVPPDKFALSLLIRGPTPPRLSETTAPVRPTTPIQAIMPITTPDSSPNIVTVPGTAPVFYPPANPINPAVPITNPAATPITVPGAATQPVTNPVTTYPSPPASTVPVTVPVTNPVGPPAITNEPATPGQSWCVARTGVAESVLQEAIDYACGLGGADCSQIQEGASCYIPNTLDNHASYAFNSYYQRNPVATSCDFGGSAVIVNSNPSTGSCIYPNTASMATPETVATPSSTTTSSSSTPTTVSPLTSSGTPEVVNPVTDTPSGFTTENPQAMNSSTSKSISLTLSLHVVVLTSLISACLW